MTAQGLRAALQRPNVLPLVGENVWAPLPKAILSLSVSWIYSHAPEVGAQMQMIRALEQAPDAAGPHLNAGKSRCTPMMFMTDQPRRDNILFALAGAVLAIAAITIWC
jgi:hypothetical protein